MERLAVNARHRIWLSFRIFDAATKLRTAEARDHANGDDWAALLAARASAGVDVRVQVADFDPVAAADLHGAAWASLRAIGRALTAVESTAEAMPARHPARFGLGVAAMLSPVSRKERRTLKTRHGAMVYEKLPCFGDHENTVAPRIHPASHHQKLAVFDDAAIVGGLDVDERRWDTPEHDMAAPETWRDATLLVRGQGAAQAADVFAEIWNDARAHPPRVDLPDGITVPTAILLETKTQATEQAIEQATEQSANDFTLLLTRSVPGENLFGFGPEAVDDSIFQATVAAIGKAKSFLYIETQFLRSSQIADALCDAANRAPDLEVVIVLPFAPERFAFKGHRNKVMRHAEALQLSAIKRIEAAFGPRCAILSPAKPTRAEQDDQFTAYGAGIVYVHSKILIADAETAIVGSANLNDRSLRWDTEVSALWRDATGVAAFQRRLAQSWLGDDVAANPGRVATWREAAARNAARAPDARDGFLLPHDTQRAERFARRVFWLPNELF